MNRNLRTAFDIDSSFLSCEKDAEKIIRKLFIESQPYSDYLKRLLVINTYDCLDLNNAKYNQIIKDMTVQKIFEQGYIRLKPKIKLAEHEDVKSYILLSFDGFTPNAQNPQFRDCIVVFDIICNVDYWNMGDYQIRPLKICGYIDGLLNNTKLSGIGTFQFAGCNELILDQYLAGYTLTYYAVHGTDDIIPVQE